MKEKTKKNVEKKKDKKKEVVAFEDLKLIRIFAIVVGVIFVIMFCLSFMVREFIPATLIALALESFTIAYYYYEKKDSQKLTYLFFITGAIVLLISVVYTIVRVV